MNFPPMEPDDNPQDNQLLPVVFQALPYQFDEAVEDNELIRNQDGTIQLNTSSLPGLLHLIKKSSPKISSFNKRLKKIEEKNDMRALNREIIDRDFYRALQAGLKRNLVLSVVYSLFKRPCSSMAEFYCRVLSVYMLNTSLPKRLNVLLKGGVLNQEDPLLPFLMCLCKAFFCKTLNLNQIDGVKEGPLNLYQEVEDNEGNYFLWQRFQLKEFWVMKTEKPDFLKLLGKGVKIYSEGFYYKLMAPDSVKNFFDHIRYLRTCLHIEVPEEIARDKDYSGYLKLVQERILFIKEANQVIFAPGCNFIVDELVEIPVKKVTSEISQEEEAEYLEEKIRIIKLKMVAKISQGFNLEEEQDPRLAEEEAIIPFEQEQEARLEVEEGEEEPQEEQQAGVEAQVNIFETPIYDQVRLFVIKDQIYFFLVKLQL